MHNEFYSDALRIHRMALRSINAKLQMKITVYGRGRCVVNINHKSSAVKTAAFFTDVKTHSRVRS